MNKSLGKRIILYNTLTFNNNINNLFTKFDLIVCYCYFYSYDFIRNNIVIIRQVKIFL